MERPRLIVSVGRSHVSRAHNLSGGEVLVTRTNREGEHKGPKASGDLVFTLNGENRYYCRILLKQSLQ